MSEGAKRGLIVYRENKPFVRRALGAGQVDYIDLTEWSFADRFSAFLLASDFLGFAQLCYPTPRDKEEVPVWFLTACALQLKLHAEPHFRPLQHLLRSGAVLQRVRFNVGLHPGGGFNNKNRGPRDTMVDQDTVRKFYKDTPAVRLFRWFNEDVARWVHQQGGFAAQGRFVADLTLAPVPDNPHYPHVSALPLDEHGQYVDTSALTPQEKRKVRYTPCYALVSLLHVRPEDEGYVYAGAYLLTGACNAIRTLRRLVRNFVRAVGQGVIKQFILDRGFVDGSLITDLKCDYGIDVLIPLKANMNALSDALSLIEASGSKWRPYRTDRDEEGGEVKEEVAGVGEVDVWDSCRLPLYVAVMRVSQADGTVRYWGLASTRAYEHAADAFHDYKDRTDIEERHRQLKECWNLCRFPSPAFNLVAMHVYFTLLVYTLIQLYLNEAKLHELTQCTIDTLQRQERLGLNAVIVYAGQWFATFDLDDYTHILVHLRPKPLERMRKWIRVFRETKTRAP